MKRFPHESGALLVPASILVGSLIIAGAIMTAGLSSRSFDTQTGAGTQYNAAQQRPPAVAVDSSKVKTDGEPFIGRADAPVTIAYWFDYQCPFCRQNEEATVPNLVKNYVDTGKVRIVFKDYQFLGPDSTTMGVVARAVWETAPDKFYDWHKAIFDNQGTENTGWATKEKITQITAGVLGVQVTDKVIALAEKNADLYAKDMDADKAEGVSFGVSGTPAMVIGKTIVSGAQPYAAFKSAIDTALAGK